MRLQITPIASLLPKAMPTTHTTDITANLPKPQTQQPVSRIINPLINFRHFALSCRVLDTDLLIIYKAGSFAGGPNNDLIHISVTKQHAMITLSPIKFKLTKEDLMMHNVLPETISSKIII